MDNDQFKKLAAECWELWDKDHDHKVGKLLRALAGEMPGYRQDIDLMYDEPPFKPGDIVRFSTDLARIKYTGNLQFIKSRQYFKVEKCNQNFLNLEGNESAWAVKYFEKCVPQPLDGPAFDPQDVAIDDAIEDGLMRPQDITISLLTPDPNVAAVCQKYATRSIIGLEKYGVTTERTDLDTAAWLQHLQDELMDATIYIERLKVELKIK